MGVMIYHVQQPHVATDNSNALTLPKVCQDQVQHSVG
jgi:hypothetical protein